MNPVLVIVIVRAGRVEGVRIHRADGPEQLKPDLERQREYCELSVGACSPEVLQGFAQEGYSQEFWPIELYSDIGDLPKGVGPSRWTLGVDGEWVHSP